MAVQGTIETMGGLTATNAYLRISDLTVKKIVEAGNKFRAPPPSNTTYSEADYTAFPPIEGRRGGGRNNLGKALLHFFQAPRLEDPNNLGPPLL